MMNDLGLTLFSFSLVLACAACSSADTTSPSSSSGSSDGSLFDVGAGATPNDAEVTGIWESAEPKRMSNGHTTIEQRLRFELRADHLVAAARCQTDDGSAEPVEAEARAKGSVTADAIQVGEPLTAKKQLGSLAMCGVQVAAGTLPRCAADSAPEARKMCFALEGGELTLYQASGPVAFAKIAD